MPSWKPFTERTFLIWRQAAPAARARLVQLFMVVLFVISVLATGFAYRASSSLIPQLDQDPYDLVWTAHQLRREFGELRAHLRLYSVSHDPSVMDAALLWLDVVVNQLNTLAEGRASNYAPTRARVQRFAEKQRAKALSLEPVMQRAFDSSKFDYAMIKPTMDAMHVDIEAFQLEQHNLRTQVAVRRGEQAEDLAHLQQMLIAAAGLSVAILIASIAARSRRAHWLARHDVLTGLANRSGLMERMEQLAGSMVKIRDDHNGRGREEGFAVHMVDVDHFQIINNTAGYRMGDEVLRAVAERLGRRAADTRSIARIGGDSFAIIQEDCPDARRAASFARDIVVESQAPLMVCGAEMRIGVSVGSSIFGLHGHRADLLFEQADLALLDAKKRGRNQSVLFDPILLQRAASHREIDHNLHLALCRDEFELHYQPKIDLQSGMIIGAEALLRWRQPELGMVRPDQFIPIAEETGMIAPIGRWVLDRACADAKRWSLMCGDPFHVAVNLSPLQFEDADLAEDVIAALRRHGLQPQNLELELTETTLLAHSGEVHALIDELRQIGIRFALDDFGTGYSSLSYLQRFNFDKVKIDRSFVMAMAPGERRSPIIEAIIHISQGLGFSVCAEGVEDAHHAEFLRDMGCHEAQGFHFAKPMPADAFQTFLQNGRSGIADRRKPPSLAPADHLGPLAEAPQI